MLMAAVLHLGDVHFAPLTEADTAFPSDLQLLERGQCHQRSTCETGRNLEFFFILLEAGEWKSTHACAQLGSVFSAFPRLPHYTTQLCDPVTSDISETVNKWHQLLNGKEPSVVLEMWCHGRRCQRWDPGLLSPRLLVNGFCSEIRWWLISANSGDRWGTNEPAWGSWCAGSVASLSGQRAVPWMSSVLSASRALIRCYFNCSDVFVLVSHFFFLCRVCPVSGMLQVCPNDLSSALTSDVQFFKGTYSSVLITRSGTGRWRCNDTKPNVQMAESRPLIVPE